MNLPQPPEPRSNTTRRPQVASADAAVLDICLPAIQSLSCGIDQPFAVAVPLDTPQIQTVGCLLPEGEAAIRGSEVPSRSIKPVIKKETPKQIAAAESKDVPLDSFKPFSRTRIRPPQDVVKLEDRLFYLLQPPLENIFSSESLSFPFRPFPYQYDGVAFLYPRNEAVLADEMGLGKTMQTIVAMRLLAHQGHVRRALIVCPKPLVTNWQREIALWAPELPVTVIEGKQSRREWLWQNASCGVLIANYESLVRDHLHAKAVEAPFDLMITDETQRIKNRLSTTNQVVCSIPRRRSWALTGTPIENSSEDLVGIFQFVSPGCLQPLMKPASIRKAVDDYVIRRTKDHVLTDLPPKMFRDANVILTPEQQQAYDLAENEGVVRLNELNKELTIQHVFELVLRLKQICNFDPITGSSAKVDRLEADLEECAASGRKAIVFSQWVDTIEKLRQRLERFGPLEYHGKIPTKHRDSVIESFRNEPDHQVLLMSYGAGSVGLNLQFAGYVFLFDRWWNPAVEDQAINRAHRIGAAGPVTVTRFLASGTIEDRINHVLEEKRELFHSIFDPDAATGKLGLSRDEIFGLFKLNFPDSDGSADAA